MGNRQVLEASETCEYFLKTSKLMMILKRIVITNQITKTEHSAVIRLLNEADFLAYKQLDEEIIASLKMVGTYQANTDEFAQNCISQRMGFAFGCFVEDEMVAYSMVFVPKDSPKNLGLDVDLPKAYLSQVVHRDSVGVKPAFRGNGIQGILGRVSTKIILEKGYPFLFSTVHPQNTASLRNLTKQGFVIVKVKKKYGGKWRCILQYFPEEYRRYETNESIFVPQSDIDGQQKLLEEGYLGVEALRNGTIKYERLKIDYKQFDS